LDEIQCRFGLGEVLVIQGKFTEALAQFGEAESVSGRYYRHDFNPIPLESRLFIGMAFVRQREFRKAESAGKEMPGIITKRKMEPIYLDSYYLLEAETARAQDNPKEALGFLDQASFVAWRDSPFYWQIRAAAEEALGQYGSAIESNRKFLGAIEKGQYFRGESVRYYYELSMVDYNLGRIAEKMNDTAAAGDHYRKFLEGMKAADPGIPEVADARKRLAALQ
jgi:tetratricopeptide (TPR) repeat protein